MTTRALVVALAFVAAVGCKATPSASPPPGDAGRDGLSISETGSGPDAGSSTDASHCFLGQSTIGDCAL